MITLEINGRRVQVGDEFRSMSPEQQEATVNEIASSFSAAPEPQQQSNDPGAIGWVNRGIANTIDGMANLANTGFNAAIRGGANVLGIDDPYQLQTNPTANLMDMAGVARADQAPETLMQQAFTGAGEAAGALLPFGVAARGLGALGGTAGGVGQALQQPFAQAPVRALGAELSAGAGARVGGEMASDASEGAYGDIARPFGEVAGGLAAALAPGAALNTAVGTANLLPGVRAGRAIAAREFAPFTASGAREIARNRVRGLSADPDAQAAMIDANSPLTPAQQTGDQNLMALERGVIDQNPTMRPEFEAGNLRAAEMLMGDIRQGTADVSQATDLVRRRTDAVIGRLNQSVERANAAAQRRIEALSPQRAASENSVIVREELDKAYNAAKAEENRLWSAIPDDVTVPTQNARAAFRAVQDRAGQVNADLVPAAAQRWLGGNSGFGDETPIRDVQSLYSRLRETARNARRGENPSAFTASSADSIADGILQDFGNVSGLSDNVSGLYQVARNYTAQMRELFNQGTVGRIRARTEGGGNRVEPELTLDRALGSGTRGAVGYDDLSAAAGQGIDAPVQDFLLNRLQSRGDFTPARGEAFMRQNSELVSRFPELQGNIQSASNAIGTAQRTGQRVGDFTGNLQNARVNPSAAFTQARPGQEVANGIFSAQEPVAAARQIARQVSRDQTGQGMAGLKGGVVDYLMGRAATGYGETGDRLISGNTLNGLLQDPPTRAALREIYDVDELSRLDRIAKEFQGLETSRRVTPMGDILDVEPNRLISYIGGTFAARAGARLGAGTSGASLRTASQATQRFNRMLQSLTGDRAEALIRDAVTDPELFRDLLRPMNTPARRERVERRLVEWLEGYAATQIAGENE